ncbi:MAG TPA: M28 family peptidase [Candidatus Krumholzibacteria bacterium]|nr:M28 family peptidase [Candidatus Krumholzibacteria bacterium]HPD71215.1 M28 family peptidase [Candidatus Krumholzibacteria bacterium]HRY39085.1 M28 family peptidase [Candidatus Krumholzibacteria bacterium]
MRLIDLTLLVVVAGGLGVQAADVAARAEPAGLATTIAALTAPRLAGRGSATAGERDAAALVAAWFAEAGLAPAGPDESGWFQAFALPGAAEGDSSLNVLGCVPGCGDLEDRWIVVGAHLDHLGRVDPRGKGVPAPGEYYPGAGDNASGVAVLRHVAVEAVATRQDPGARRSLLVCAFGAEEVGLLGSAWFAANPPVPPGQVDAMVNLDAVGKLGAGPLHVAGLETCPLLPDLIAAAAGDLPVRSQDPSLVRSDHASFLAHGIPALFLFTGAYPEMNSTADSLGAVDLDGLARVAEVAVRLVDGLRRASGRFTFVAPPESAPLLDAGNRQTWLGTVPDFEATSGSGYVVGDVIAGGPAALAGLRAGDVLRQLGGAEVAGLAGFTEALRRHDPGDIVEIRVERDGRLLGFFVTLGDRSQRPR